VATALEALELVMFSLKHVLVDHFTVRRMTRRVRWSID
jgi:hypothetical protein